MHMKNAVALITGASRGIGRGIALELGKVGWDLSVNYLTNEAAARRTATECIATAKAGRVFSLSVPKHRSRRMKRVTVCS